MILDLTSNPTNSNNFARRFSTIIKQAMKLTTDDWFLEYESPVTGGITPISIILNTSIPSNGEEFQQTTINAIIIDFVNDKICTIYPPHYWPEAPKKIYHNIYRHSDELTNFKDEIHHSGANWIDVNRIQAVEIELTYMQCQIDVQVN